MSWALTRSAQGRCETSWSITSGASGSLSTRSRGPRLTPPLWATRSWGARSSSCPRIASWS
eukprot:8643475-Pyramimonas_sp.AAC.1